MEFKFSDRISGLSGAATREIFKLLTRPEIVSFAGGFPATQCLPIEDVKKITDEILSGGEAVSALQYGATEGFNSLREQIIGYVKDVGINCALDEVQVLSGGQQGIDLMCKAFLNTGDTVLVEDPTYLTALQIFATYQSKVVGVKSDKNGLDLGDLEQKITAHKPKFLYIVPTFSNPTGKTYTLENRKKICELTAKHNVMVLEDDPYSKLRFAGTPVQSLKSMDTVGNVVYVTSFSKVLAPGLRCGAAVGHRDVIRKIAIGKQGVDVTTTNLSQLIVAHYLKKGLLYPNIEKSLPIYRERKTAMINAIKKYMPAEYTYNDPEGGLFIWGELNAKINVAPLLPKAVERNVAYIQGSVFYANGGGLNTLRLNFSNAAPDKIETGIKALGGLFKEELANLR